MTRGRGLNFLSHSYSLKNGAAVLRLKVVNADRMLSTVPGTSLLPKTECLLVSGSLPFYLAKNI